MAAITAGKLAAGPSSLLHLVVLPATERRNLFDGLFTGRRLTTIGWNMY